MWLFPTIVYVENAGSLALLFKGRGGLRGPVGFVFNQSFSSFVGLLPQLNWCYKILMVVLVPCILRMTISSQVYPMQSTVSSDLGRISLVVGSIYVLECGSATDIPWTDLLLSYTRWGLRVINDDLTNGGNCDHYGGDELVHTWRSCFYVWKVCCEQNI